MAAARTLTFDLDKVIVRAAEGSDDMSDPEVALRLVGMISPSEKDAALIELLPSRIATTRRKYLWKSLGNVRKINVAMRTTRGGSKPKAAHIKVVVRESKEQKIHIPGYGWMRLGDCAPRHLLVKAQEYFGRRDAMDACGQRFKAAHDAMVERGLARVDKIPDAVFVETMGTDPLAD